jgi:hypothetical protein
MVGSKPVQRHQETDRVGLVDASLFDQCGLKIGENRRATSRVGTKVCPKASVVGRSTTPLVKSGIHQTQLKKIVSRKKARHGAGTRRATTCFAKALKQRSVTLTQRRVQDKQII